MVLELTELLPRGFSLLVKAAEREIDPGVSGLEDVAVREALAQCWTEIAITRLLCRKMIENLMQRGGVGPEASVIKVFYSELLRRLNDLGLQLKGMDAHRYEAKPLTSSWESGRWLLDYLSSWEWTIGGGTNEIQRNLIGERILDLPREPSIS
jgi:alkylation response protein AidB-like acyl-CoA dehydrogenase